MTGGLAIKGPLCGPIAGKPAPLTHGSQLAGDEAEDGLR